MILALHPAVRMRVQRGGETVRIGLTQRTLLLRALTPGIRRVLRMLANHGAAESALSDVVLKVDGAAALPRWYYCLESLQSFGAVCCVLRQRARTMVRLTSGSRFFRMTSPGVDDDTAYWLSRFAYVRRDGKCFVLESPLSGARLELADRRAVVLLAALSCPTTLGELAAAAPGTEIETARLFLSLLSGARMLEEPDPVTGDWDFADLIFHASSRGGPRYVVAPTKNRVRWRPPPAIKPAMSTTVIPLCRPDLELLKTRDVPFTRVLEARRSLRSYSAVPLAARQLGEFLFRTARVRRMTRARVAGALRRFTLRPYPSGGACYSLELYVVIGDCREMSRGLYHYDPLHHRLEVLAASGADVDRLLRRASATAGQSTAPQVLIVIAARFRRVTWKYRSMAYALVLKEVGVLMHTMYLVATAMNLAPCALGGGDPELFAHLIGTRFEEETSVGEFLLGSRQATE